MRAIYLPSPSTLSDCPSPLFSFPSSVKFRKTSLKQFSAELFPSSLTLTRALKALFGQGLGAVEPPDRGPAVPLLERKRGGKICLAGFKCFSRVEKKRSLHQATISLLAYIKNKLKKYKNESIKPRLIEMTFSGIKRNNNNISLVNVRFKKNCRL